MNGKITILIATCAVLAAGSARHAVQAQGTSVGDAVYSEAQAKRGAALYTEQCAACHGEDLKGNELMPALAGDAFVTTWKGRTVGELFEKIGLTMPALDPGSLEPEQTAEIIAHMLSVSKYPAGASDLPAQEEALRQITIDAPRP